jgi:hypothetical protein
MQAPLLPPQPQTLSRLQPVRLLRALLREASYLPDANARRFFRRYIVNRFRAYQPAPDASQAVEKKRHGFGKRRDIAIIQQRARALQYQGNKGLNYLRRANNGEYACLQKILFLTYGRMGKRKYALLEHLLRPDDPAAVGEPAPLQKLYHSNDRFLSFFDAPKKASPTHYNIPISDRYRRLKTAIKAQVQNEVALGREMKRPHLHTPINNIWERPMPIKRARNNVRRWYAETMTRLLPPLPTEEFDEVQAMADGRKEISLVKRRSPAILLHPGEEPSAADRFAMLVQDALVLEKPNKADKRIHPRRIDARFMRRMYAAVLSYCSKLEWNERYKKWDAVWGNRIRRMNSGIDSEALHGDLFAGVDEKGNVPKEKQSELRSLEGSLADHQKANGKKEQFTVVPFYIDFLPPDHPTRITAGKPSGKRTGSNRQVGLPLAKRP